MEAGWRGADKQVVKDLFGRPLRVALASWIISRAGDPFYVQQAQQAMLAVGEASSGVTKELRVFEAHGLLLAVQDGRRIYFTPIASPFWPAFEGIADACGFATAWGHG